MANFYASYPVGSGGAAGSNPSVGPNGALIPLDSTLVAGESPTGTLQPLQTDASGNLLVSIAAEPGAPIDVNVAKYGGTATTLGQKASVASQPVVIASDQSSVPVTAAQPTASALNATVVQGTASNLLAQVSQPTAASLNATVVQSTGSNLHVNVDNFPATQPVSGTVSATQGTSPWVDNLTQIAGANVQTGHGTAAGTLRVELPTDGTGSIANITGTISLPTGASTSANQTNASQKTQIVDGSGNVIASTSNALNTTDAANGPVSPGSVAGKSELSGGQFNTTLPTLTNTQQAAMQVDVRGRQITVPATPVALTVTQAAITVGTSAVRLTVSGSAPSATRIVLAATPDTASTATFYIGSATVTNSGSTRGIELVAGQSFIANNDAGDYYIVSSTTSQTVTVMEQA